MMNARDIAVWSCSRISSTRCPNKMVRSFSGTTLIDIFMAKLARLKSRVFFAGYEETFREKCEFHGVPFVQRTRRSALADKPAEEIYGFLKDQRHDYLLFVNSCAPFIRTRTIVDFLKSCEADRRPGFGVYRKRNYFVELEGAPINWSQDTGEISTEDVEPIYEFAHLFYFFEREYFLKNGWFWDWSEVRYIEIPSGLETFKIDTEEDFFLAEAAWKETGYSVT